MAPSVGLVDYASVRPFDPIDLLEAFYARPGSMDDWLDQVNTALIAPFGAGASLFGYRVNLLSFELENMRCIEPDKLAAFRKVVAEGAANPERQAEVRKADPMGLYTTSEILSTYDDSISADSYALAAPDGEERMVVFCAPLDERATVSDELRPLWRRIAAHLGAASRMIDRSDSLDDEKVEAVLEPNGKLLHAHGQAKTKDTQAVLRRITKHIDRARTREGRKDPNGALDLWTGLILGRWSIVDHFDTDGRRFSVARKNDPARPEMAGMSKRERQVAFYTSLGLANKQIGYSLGLAESTVASHVAKILDKLRLQTRGQLIEMAAKASATKTYQSPAPSP